jgi:ankyrin repeat protein
VRLTNDPSASPEWCQTRGVTSPSDRALALCVALRASGASDAEIKAALATYRHEHHALTEAVDSGSLDAVRKCLAEGASPGDVDPLGSPAIVCAASLGRVDIVRALLDAGADIDARDAYDGTAFWHAANGEHVELCRALLAWGADPTLTNDAGEPPWGRARGALSAELRRATGEWTSRRR